MAVWSKFKAGNRNRSKVFELGEDGSYVIARFRKEKLIDVNKNKPPYCRVTVADSVRIGKALSASVTQKRGPWRQNYFIALYVRFEYWEKAIVAFIIVQVEPVDPDHKVELDPFF